MNADITTIQFVQVGNDLVVADALDTAFENFASLTDWFVSSDHIDYVVDADGLGYDLNAMFA